MKFLLCADLHLKNDEKEYSFSVLNEILDICKMKDCGALLFAGDVFDSWEDVEKLRNDFRGALEKLPSSCNVYLLPGNHEELRSAGSFDGFDFGRAKLLAKKPWSLLELGTEAEIIAVPFQRDYSAYREWNVPAKKRPLRILLSHGTVPGIAYIGPGEEGADGVLDEDLFAHLQVDLAALGHLHGQTQIRKGKTLVAYPGSARVWRAGEEGERCVLLGNTETIPQHLEPIGLASAGKYRVVSVYAAPGGELKYRLPEGFSTADWLHFEVEGVVEDEPAVIAELEKIKAELGKNCRKVSSNTGKLSVLAGVSSHPLAIRFLRVWEEKAGSFAGEEPGVYNLVRLVGLSKLKDFLGQRK